MYDHLTPANKTEIESLEGNNSVVENGELKTENEILKEEKNGIISHLICQNCETYKELLPTLNHNEDEAGNVPGLHNLVDVEDAVDGKPNEAIDSFTPCILSTKEIEFNESDTDFFTDKTVTECEMSKLIVCLKEGKYHVVKDIRIDERVSSLDKVLFKDREVNHKGLYSFLDSDMDIRSDLSKEKLDSERNKTVPNQGGSEKLKQKLEKNITAGHEITNTIDEKAVSELTVLEEELEKENTDAELTKFGGSKSCQRSDQDASKETNLANPVISSFAEDLNNEHANVVPFDSKVASGSITFNFDTPTPATNCKDESTQDADIKQPVQTLDMFGIEDGIHDSRTASSRSFYIQHGLEESSFSSLVPLSGPIAYSGSIPYSGSISLRSDSSTTSTRSFAFPILNSEWNSSPIKMAKADRRHYRKHRCWGIGLLCCKF